MSLPTEYQTWDAGEVSAFRILDAPGGYRRITPAPGDRVADDAQREALRLLATSPHSYANDATWEAIACEDQLTRSTYRVLLTLISLVEPGNYIYSNAHLVAQLLGMHYRTCLESWGELRTLGYLLPETNEWGRVICWRLSPGIAWRGRPWKAGIAQRQLEGRQALEALEQEALRG